MMKKIGDPTAPSVDIATIKSSDLRLYEEDLKADSIDNFVRNKKIAMKVINQKIDFTVFFEYAVRYNEIFIPSIPMDQYSDTGYRFRYNQFNKQDGYVYPIDSVDAFYDYF
jgi:hypothetical protein